MVLTDARWRGLAPLIDEVRPRCKVPHTNLRRTVEAILWRHQNGAKWRGIPAEFGPWWKAAQTFIRTRESKALAGLLHGLRPGAVVGDSAFDGSPTRDTIAALGAAAAVVPSNPCRSRPIPHDRHLYRERNLVERCFQRFKQFRRVAAPCDKTAASFLALATLAASMTLLR